MKDSGIISKILFPLFIIVSIIPVSMLIAVSAIYGVPIYIGIIEIVAVLYIYYRLYIYFRLSGYLYVNYSKALSENKKLAQECCERVNQIELPKDVVDSKKKLIKSFLLMLGSILLICITAFSEILCIIAFGVFLWLFFYTAFAFHNYKEKAKSSITADEVASIEKSYYYQRLVPNIPLDTKLLDNREEISEMRKKQIEARNSYEDAEFDSEAYTSNNVIDTVQDDIELDINSSEKIHVQLVNTVKDYGTDGEGRRHLKIIFNGIFVNYSDYATENDYSIIRFTNAKILVSKDYLGKRIQISDNRFNKRFAVYSDNDLMVKELFSTELVDMLLKMNELYKLKYEVLIQNHNIYIRIYENRLFKVHIIGKRVKVKDVARDITTIQYAKLLAESLYNATNK